MDVSKKGLLQVFVFPEVVQFDWEREGYRAICVNSFFRIAAEISQKMEQKEKGKAILKISFPFQ